MAPVKIALTILGAQTLFDDPGDGYRQIAAMADDAGIHQLNVGDHVVMSANVSAYPFGKFPVSPSYDAFDPLVLMANLAAVTKRVRLSTGVLVSPLRPAVLLAKQIATLDALCGGRVDIGLGVGWQKAEYDASGVPWEGRFGLMIEQVRACRALWGPSPSAYHGDKLDFADLYCHPKPVQGAALTVLLGLSPTSLNVQRLAEVADGWVPPPTLEDNPEAFGLAVSQIKTAMAERGRDPDALQVRMSVPVIKGAHGRPDIEASAAKGAAFVERGATMLDFRLRQFANGRDEIPDLLARLAALQS